MGKNKKKGKHHAGYGANQNRANTGGQRQNADDGHGGGRAPVATSAETHFINPYTFVPIEDKEPCRKEFLRGAGEFEGETSKEKLSGYLECSLEVKSPLFIPNTNKRFKLFGTMFDNKDKKDRIFFDEFFSYDDMYGCEVGNKFGEEYPKDAPKYPRIPGSEIKGVVRNIYEQLTNSCLCVIDEENLPYKRTSKPKQAGILDVKTGVLYQAERLMLNTGHGDGRANFGKRVNNEGDKIWYKTGDLVYVKPTADTYTTINNGGSVNTGTRGVDDIQETSMQRYQKGYVLIGEKFGKKKHHNSVLIFKALGGRLIREKVFKKDDMNRFEEVLKRYQDPPHKEYADVYKEKKNGTGTDSYLPVFYSCVKNGANMVYYLSPAMITKEVFDKTISKLLEENHFKHQPCDGRGGWCPACRLFGMVGKGEGSSEALASRLRFTDTEVIEGAEFDKPQFLPILGTPQYSSTEFYLKKPDGDPQIWNYDYRIDVLGRNRVETSYKAKLKGRKVYWLGKKEDIGMIPIPKENVRTRVREQKLNMTSAVRCLTKGSTKFKVYFEDVTKEELSALIFCLNLEEESFHRIGRGKPYGMGAVKIKVDEAKALKYRLKEGTINRVEEDIKLKDYNLDNSYDNAKKYILTYSKELEEGESNLLSYPRITDVNKPEIFRWFTKNRGTVGKEKIDQILFDVSKGPRALRK